MSSSLFSSISLTTFSIFGSTYLFYSKSDFLKFTESFDFFLLTSSDPWGLRTRYKMLSGSFRRVDLYWDHIAAPSVDVNVETSET